MAKPRKKKRKLLFVLEIAVLLLFIGGLYVYGQFTSRLDNIEQPVFEEERVAVNPEAPKMTGYSTYALFGIDHRSKNAQLGAENSDTIIIASVNNDTQEVRLVSVYRDTLLNIGDNTYSKANAAYAYGGPEQAISMLNTNLDLNITDYVTIDFNALVTAVDALGGLDIPLSYAEIVHMNNYCVETAQETGKSYTPVPQPSPEPADLEAIVDTYHLNGVQATSYCRIRYTGSLDMGRTQRQRMVIGMLVDKAKKAGLSTVFKIMDEVFPMVKTSLGKTQILKLIPSVIGYNMGDTTGFPIDYKFSNAKGSIIVATSLESNVIALHKFLYGDVAYTPSPQVLEASQKINEIVAGAALETTPAPASGDEDADNSFVWYQETEGSWQDNSEYVEPNQGGGNEEPDPNGGGTEDPNGGGYEEPDPNGGGTEDPNGGGGYEEPDPNGGGYEEPDPNGGGYEEPDPNGGGYEEPDPNGGGYEEPDPSGGEYIEPVPEDGGDFTYEEGTVESPDDAAVEGNTDMTGAESAE